MPVIVGDPFQAIQGAALRPMIASSAWRRQSVGIRGSPCQSRTGAAPCLHGDASHVRLASEIVPDCKEDQMRQRVYWNTPTVMIFPL